MANLEHLALTNNKLQNKSIPYTLIFCHNLRTLLLDNNLLDALPGFLLKMPSLETVHRHGNHNYFKSTFMWYHTDVNERILSIGHVSDFVMRQPETLQFWATQAVIGSKVNFYRDPAVAPVLREYITSIYTMFNVCVYCNTAKLLNQAGLCNFVIIFLYCSECQVGFSLRGDAVHCSLVESQISFRWSFYRQVVLFAAHSPVQDQLCGMHFLRIYVPRSA